MTKRKREEDERPELQMLDTCLDQPLTTNQEVGATQIGSLSAGLPVPENRPTDCTEAAFAATSPSYVGETPSSDEVATETTSAALEGGFGPFWALLARAGYTVW